MLCWPSSKFDRQQWKSAHSFQTLACVTQCIRLKSHAPSASSVTNPTRARHNSSLSLVTSVHILSSHSRLSSLLR